MFMENHHLLPLLSSSTSSTIAAGCCSPRADVDGSRNNLFKLISSNSGILVRLSLIVLIGILSFWANHEASKGYAITIVNESRHTFAGRRFHLFYVCNDEASRIVIKASRAIENILYPYSHDIGAKKQVGHVTLKLSHRNLTDDVTVESGAKSDEFVLTVSPSVMQKSNFRHAMSLAVLKGMARVWLWDGRRNAPGNLINGIVEYMTNNSPAADLERHRWPCWNHNNAGAVANFLAYCERRYPGLVRKLNQAMRDGWDAEIFCRVVGQPVENMCMEYVQNIYSE